MDQTYNELPMFSLGSWVTFLLIRCRYLLVTPLSNTASRSPRRVGGHPEGTEFAAPEGGARARVA